VGDTGLLDPCQPLTGAQTEVVAKLNAVLRGSEVVLFEIGPDAEIRSSRIQRLRLKVNTARDRP